MFHLPEVRFECGGLAIFLVSEGGRVVVVTVFKLSCSNPDVLLLGFMFGGTSGFVEDILGLTFPIQGTRGTSPTIARFELFFGFVGLVLLINEILNQLFVVAGDDLGHVGGSGV